jgi:hypothetical protein
MKLPHHDRGWKIKHELLTILAAPKHMGQPIFDIFGRGDKSAELSNVIIGYFGIVVTALILWGIIDLNARISIWRFFFPVKP